MTYTSQDDIGRFILFWVPAKEGDHCVRYELRPKKQLMIEADQSGVIDICFLRDVDYNRL